MLHSPFDPIRKAAHYNQHPSGVECIEIIRHFPANLANAFKYLFRYRYKGQPAADVRKAAYYLRDQARYCGVATDAIPDRAARLALEVAQCEYDWRATESIKRMISARTVGEYETAADLLEKLAADIDENSPIDGDGMNDGEAINKSEQVSTDAEAFRRAGLRLAGVVERLADDVAVYRRKNRELETQVAELTARVAELEAAAAPR